MIMKFIMQQRNIETIRDVWCALIDTNLPLQCYTVCQNKNLRFISTLHIPFFMSFNAFASCHFLHVRLCHERRKSLVIHVSFIRD
jgi:hypothetical protein